MFLELSVPFSEILFFEDIGIRRCLLRSILTWAAVPYRPTSSVPVSILLCYASPISITPAQMSSEADRRNFPSRSLSSQMPRSTPKTTLT